MKAAIYCRLSKEDETRTGESESIQNQKSMLIQYAMEQEFELYQIYSDEDYSGIDRNRPAFNAMIQAASEHRFDVVLAKTQSRFTRDMELVENTCTGSSLSGASALSQWWTMWIPTIRRTKSPGRSMG